MTHDTERALEIIKPIADELGIKVYADDNFLYCEFHNFTQPIGITFNSTYATIKEFIGYLAAWIINRQDIEWSEFEEYVKRHWLTLEVVTKMSRVESLDKITDEGVKASDAHRMISGR